MTRAEAITAIMAMTDKQKARLKLIKVTRDALRKANPTGNVGAQEIASEVPGRSVGTTHKYLEILEASESEEPSEQPAETPPEPSVLAEKTEELSATATILRIVAAESEEQSDRISELEELLSTTATDRDVFASSLNAAKAEIGSLKSERDLIQAKFAYAEQSISVLKTVLSDANRDLEKYRKDSHTIFEMKVQCSRAEEQRAAVAREAEALRSTIDAMIKTHEHTLARSHDELTAAKTRASELEDKLMAALRPNDDAEHPRTSPAATDFGTTGM